MSKFVFSEQAWEEYLYWQMQDKKTLKRINKLLKDISKNWYKGLGKPEPLKYTENWSRRIDSCNRLVYRIHNNTVEVIQCKGHY